MQLGAVEMARPVVIMLVAVMLASIILGGNGQVAVYAWPVDALTVCIDEPTTRQAMVSDTQNGSLTFSGTVQVNRLPVERIVVEFVVTVDIKWVAVLSPSSIVITSTNIYWFNLTVIVPEATHADAVGHFTVTATGRGGDIKVIDKTNVTVTVAPYSLLSIGSDRPYREILPQEGTSFAFKVQNRGNAIDSYELEIANARELENAGWSVEFSNRTIAGVAPEGEVNVSVTVKSPQGWSWDIWTSRPTSIIVEADSLAARNNNLSVNQTMPVHVYRKGSNNPLLSLLLTIYILTAVSVMMFAIIRRRRKKGRQTLVKEKT